MIEKVAHVLLPNNQRVKQWKQTQKTCNTQLQTTLLTFELLMLKCSYCNAIFHLRVVNKCKHSCIFIVDFFQEHHWVRLWNRVDRTCYLLLEFTKSVLVFRLSWKRSWGTSTQFESQQLCSKSNRDRSSIIVWERKYVWFRKKLFGKSFGRLSSNEIRSVKSWYNCWKL